MHGNTLTDLQFPLSRELFLLNSGDTCVAFKFWGKIELSIDLWKDVSEICNNFFINVAKDIGDENINIDKSHPSIIKIEENKTDVDDFGPPAVLS
jgi:hypothetical protein